MICNTAEPTCNTVEMIRNTAEPICNTAHPICQRRSACSDVGGGRARVTTPDRGPTPDGPIPTVDGAR